MERRVRTFLQTIFILMVIGITQANSQPAAVTNVPNNSTNFKELAGLVYFTSGETLWRTDGTASGTIQLTTGFQPAPFQRVRWQAPSMAREHNEKAYLVNRDGFELWRSDGTPSGTILLKTSSSNDISILGVTDNYLFFVASDPATGQEVYRTDGSAAGTILVRDVYPGTSSGYRGFGATLNNELLFSGNDGVNGTELWKSNGTSAGTVMVRDINPGAGNGFITRDEAPISGNVFSFNNQFYFRGNTPATGMEPWVSDGTSAGTHVLDDINTGPGNSGPPQYAIINDGVLYFLILDDFDEGPAQLFKTAGTDATTTFIKTLGEEESEFNQYYRFLIYRGKVYFWRRVQHFSDNLWVTDGTSAGTNSFFTLVTVDGGISFFEVVNDWLLFTGSNQNIPYHLYRSDGTSGGTEVFAEFKARSHATFPRDLTKVGNNVFYADHDGLTESGGGFPWSEEDWYHLFQADGNTYESMRTMWGINTIGTDNIEGLSGNVIFTTHNTQGGSADTQKKLWFYDPSGTPPPTNSFTLVNASDDEDLKRLLDGSNIRNPDHIPLNIRYNPLGTPGSVRFTLNGTPIRTETAPPYSMAGDVDGDYAPWAGAEPGTYTLTATQYSQAGGQGTAGPSLTITFTIECTSSSDDCEPTGSILREFWSGVSGNNVSAIPVGTEPDDRSYPGLFEGPANAGTNYGARYRGYVIPATTGNYTFWIASNDNSELWLSTNEAVSNKRMIASVTGATNPREWGKYPSQKSVPIMLNAGQKYYIEALHKQGAGTDNLAVGWQLPDGSMQRPIPGNKLQAFDHTSGSPTTVSVTNPVDGQTFTAPADIVIEAEASDADGAITKVEFYAGPHGESPAKIGEDVAAPYYFVWEDVAAGNYDIYAFAHDSDGNITGSAPVNVVVNEDGGCTASGTITRDYWSGVSGDRVSNVPVNRTPTSTNELTIFEAPSNIGDNYATRIRGYICPPVTGGYNFWIASNDHSELWLSTDDDPANKRRIAWVTGATNPRQWDKYRSQLSTTTIWLTKGQRYYIEALHKEAVGTDHIAVGWQFPDGTMERPIPGTRLSPFDNTSTTSLTASNARKPELYSEINIYPNPASSHDPELKVTGYEGINETVETEIRIMKMTGEVVFADRIFCGGDCGSYLVKVNDQLTPGLYMVDMKTKGIRTSKRLLVK